MNRELNEQAFQLCYDAIRHSGLYKLLDNAAWDTLAEQMVPQVRGFIDSRINDGFTRLENERSNEMTRREHLEWCKQRALEYVDAGDTQNAFTSMASDLGKHPDTANHAGIQLGMMQMMTDSLSAPDDMRKFIEGFN